jgi:hypothetical protein
VNILPHAHVFGSIGARFRPGRGRLAAQDREQNRCVGTMVANVDLHISQSRFSTQNRRGMCGPHCVPGEDAIIAHPF